LTVIPAKAGIQPGFRLALRLAGMTLSSSLLHLLVAFLPKFGRTNRLLPKWRQGLGKNLVQVLTLPDLPL
jgi:hypothetical protein